MGANSNFSTWNPLRYSSTSGITYSKANTLVETTSGYPTIMNNFAPKTGKWYYEFYNTENNGYNVLGIIQLSSITKWGNWLPDEVYLKQYMWYSHNGNKAKRNSDGTGSSTSYGSSWGSGNAIISCALDMDNGKVWWAKDGTFQDSGNPATGTNAAFDDLDTSDGFYMGFSDYNGGADGQMTINAGQDSSFGGQKSTGSADAADSNGFGNFYYTPPSGFLAPCSANHPLSSDIDPAETDDDISSKQFGVLTYTGNGTSTNAISGLGFQPDLVWTKDRGSTADYSNALVDSSRGRAKVLYSHRTDKQPTDSTSTQDVKSFDSDGFTVGTGTNIGINASTHTYVGWCWKCNGGTTSTNSSGTATSSVQVNTKAGFSISLTDNYTAATGVTIGHGLGAKPAFYMHKTTGDNSSGGASQAFNWHVYHHSLGATKAFIMNTGGAAATAIGYWNNTEPTSTVLSLGNLIAGNGQSCVWAWAEIEGYSKFGLFEGNGNADGVHIYTGFRPRMFFIKDADRSENFVTFDSERDVFNPAERGVFWNAESAESTGSGSGFDVDILANGFKLKCNHDNLNGTSTYVFGAWGDAPFKYANTHQK